MTSFGIEWDSDALVNIKELPHGIKERRAALKGHGFTITLEGIFFDDKRKTNKEHREEDCGFTIEAQLGVIKSSRDNFFGHDYGEKVYTLQDATSNFNKVWNTIIKNKKIVINDIPYPVLAYIYGPINSSFFKDSRGKPLETYKDCNLTSPGTIPDGNIDWAYIKNLDNILGKVQLTCGMKLKYFPNLFKQFTLLINQCQSHYSRCNTIPTVRETDMFLLSIKTAYINTWKQLIEEGDFDEAGNTLKGRSVEFSHNYLAYQMITNYNNLIREKIIQEKIKGKRSCEYSKACYSIKIRTNSARICEIVGNEDQNCEIDNPQIAITSIHEHGFNPLELFRPTPEALIYIKKNRGDIRLVEISNNTWLYLPIIDFEEGTSKIYLYKTGDIDFEEWWSEDDTIHFELRTLEIITALINGAPYAEQGRDLNEANMPASQINSYIQNILDKFLNPMMSLDITPILTENISPPKRRRE